MNLNLTTGITELAEVSLPVGSYSGAEIVVAPASRRGSSIHVTGEVLSRGSWHPFAMSSRRRIVIRRGFVSPLAIQEDIPGMKSVIAWATEPATWRVDVRERLLRSGKDEDDDEELEAGDFGVRIRQASKLIAGQRLNGYSIVRDPSDPSQAFLAVNTAGEILSIYRSDSLPIDHLVYRGPAGEVFKLWYKAGGKPHLAVSADETIVFENYTTDAVDVARITSSGEVEVERGVPLTAALSKLSMATASNTSIFGAIGAGDPVWDNMILIFLGVGCAGTGLATYFSAGLAAPALAMVCGATIVQAAKMAVQYPSASEAWASSYSITTLAVADAPLSCRSDALGSSTGACVRETNALVTLEAQNLDAVVAGRQAAVVAARTTLLAPSTSLLYADNFSNGLSSNWVVRGGGTWTTNANAELIGNYDIGCGSSNCSQSQLLLSDALQPGAGNWRMEVRSGAQLAYCCYNGGATVNLGKFVLFISDTRKETMSVGGIWQGTAAPQSANTVTANHQSYPWVQIADVTSNVATWQPNSWQTASLEKQGDVYTLYFNGMQVYQVTRTFPSPPKVGFNTYGAVRMDDFTLYRLP